MHRRTFLLVFGGGAASVAGCVGQPSPDNFVAFREGLRERGVDVERISRDVRRWFLEYHPDRSSERAFRTEVDAVALQYAATVPAETEASSHRLLECFLLRENNARYDDYTIAADWARRHAAGAVSESAYLERVQSGIEYGTDGSSNLSSPDG